MLDCCTMGSLWKPLSYVIFCYLCRQFHKKHQNEPSKRCPAEVGRLRRLRRLLFLLEVSSKDLQ